MHPPFPTSPPHNPKKQSSKLNPKAVVLAGLLELPAEALAELVTDRLLEVLLQRDRKNFNYRGFSWAFFGRGF